VDEDFAAKVQAAEVVLPCTELDPALSFFIDRLGFRLESVSPADDPSSAVISGHGLRLRLERGASGAPGVLRLYCRDRAGGGVLVAPNGTRIELVDAEPPLALPPLAPSYCVTRMSGAWVTGRAGMLYRDLLPDRQGGRFIASHIHIPQGGEVPDYVHFHAIRFQMIYCRAGWARLVYEDQGPPFLFEEGDCVLQPPRIRHRVLECSPGLEVIEIGSPARHDTFADHELALPTGEVRARDFAGQRFVRHRAAEASWVPCRDGFEARDLGIAAATAGLAGARVSRPSGASPGHAARAITSDRAAMHAHDGELRFSVVLRGGVTVERAGGAGEQLAAGDSFAVPAGMPHRLTDGSADLELLEVALPASAL
jgi:quercetin dioxygenase-like cupin family protein